MLNAFWGAIFGGFFALVYDRLLGKGIWKGVFIGLIYWLFSAIRPATFLAAYGDFWWTTAFTLGGTLDKFVYGILFVILYKKE